MIRACPTAKRYFLSEFVCLKQLPEKFKVLYFKADQICCNDIAFGNPLFGFKSFLISTHSDILKQKPLGFILLKNSIGAFVPTTRDLINLILKILASIE